MLSKPGTSDSKKKCVINQNLGKQKPRLSYKLGSISILFNFLITYFLQVTCSVCSSWNGFFVQLCFPKCLEKLVCLKLFIIDKLLNLLTICRFSLTFPLNRWCDHKPCDLRWTSWPASITRYTGREEYKAKIRSLALELNPHSEGLGLLGRLLNFIKILCLI